MKIQNTNVRGVLTKFQSLAPPTLRRPLGPVGPRRDRAESLTNAYRDISTGRTGLLWLPVRPHKRPLRPHTRPHELLLAAQGADNPHFSVFRRFARTVGRPHVAPAQDVRAVSQHEL